MKMNQSLWELTQGDVKIAYEQYIHDTRNLKKVLNGLFNSDMI